MKKFFFSLSVMFMVLFIINISWVIVNIYMFVIHGIESVVTGQTLIENIYYSIYLRWILLLDLIWIIAWFGYIIQRKSYKTSLDLHYLQYEKIEDPKICIIIPTFNEELSIGNVVRDFVNQKFVKHVMLINK